MFFGNDELRQDNGYGENIDININNSNFNDNMNNFTMDNNSQTMNMGTMQGPIIEPGRERVIQRNIIHEVRHVSRESDNI